jgi:hypothetical protein
MNNKYANLRFGTKIPGRISDVMHNIHNNLTVMIYLTEKYVSPVLCFEKYNP